MSGKKAETGVRLDKREDGSRICCLLIWCKEVGAVVW
jgi:hypothetical protein